MKLLVLGASGGCGQWLVELASQRGTHEVTALVRPGRENSVPQGVRLVTGEILEGTVLETVLPGQDAVACCLGQRRAGKNPWARLLSPPDFLARVMPILVPQMRVHQVSRLSVISAYGVGTSGSSVSRLVKPLLAAGQVGVAYRDLDTMEHWLQENAQCLDWQVVRPVALVHGKPRDNKAKVVDRFGLFSVIRRSEVAAWMLQSLEGPSPFHQRFVGLGT